MNILFVTSYLPYPPVSGGRLQTFLRLRHLRERGHSIYLVTLALPREYPWIEELKDYITDVVHLYPAVDRMKVKHLLRRSLLYEIFTYDRNVPKVLMNYVREKNIDIAVFEDLGVAQYRDCIPEVPAVLYKHNIDYEVVEQTVSFLRQYPAKLLKGAPDQKLRNAYLYLLGGRERQLVEELEMRLLEGFDLVITCSGRDADVLKKRGAVCETIPWSVRQPAGYHVPVEKETYTLAFIGSMDWEPNKDAVTWLVREIFPRIRQTAGRVKLVIGGSSLSREVQRLDNAGDVRVAGFIPDLGRFFLDADIFIAPVRFGGGVKVKVIEAMSHGLPVITTPAGALGLKVCEGVHLLMAGTPGEFAEKTGFLLADIGMRRSLGLKAREYTDECHNPEKIMDRLEGCLIELVRKRRERAGSASFFRSSGGSS